MAQSARRHYLGPSQLIPQLRNLCHHCRLQQRFSLLGVCYLVSQVRDLVPQLLVLNRQRSVFRRQVPDPVCCGLAARSGGLQLRFELVKVVA